MIGQLTVAEFWNKMRTCSNAEIPSCGRGMDVGGTARAPNSTSLNLSGRLARPTGELVLLGDDWLSRAEPAHLRALGMLLRMRKQGPVAGEEWQRILGAMIPLAMG